MDCTGDRSATYLQCWCCAPVAASVLPGARVIAILRDPIERAHSRFKEQVYFAKKQKNADGSVNGQPVYLGWDGFVAKLALAFKSWWQSDSTVDADDGTKRNFFLEIASTVGICLPKCLLP